MHSNKKKKEKEKKKKVDITLSVISKALNVHMKYGENSLNWKRDNRELIASQNLSTLLSLSLQNTSFNLSFVKLNIDRVLLHYFV